MAEQTKAKPKIDQQQVIKHLSLWHTGQPFELRLIKPNPKRPAIKSGLFTDPEQAAAALKKSSAGWNVYSTINPLTTEFVEYSTETKLNKFVMGSAAKDSDISQVCWLPIDIDRAGDNLKKPASAAELSHVLELSEQVIEYLKDAGFVQPLIVQSGNGLHLTYRLSGLVTPEQIKAMLQHLEQKFKNKYAHIDTSIFNPSRILRLAGTLNVKGTAADDRPHRMAVLQSTLQTVKATNAMLLQSFLRQQNKPAESDSPYDLAMVQKALDQQSISYTRKDKGDYVFFELETCLVNPQHNGTGFGVGFVLDTEAPFYKCHHNTCQGQQDWSVVKPILFPNGLPKKAKRKAKFWTIADVGELIETAGFNVARSDLDDTIWINGEIISDASEARIRALTLDKKVPKERHKVGLSVLADKYKFHPIRDYLTSLDYDADHSPIATLATHIICPDQPYFAQILRRWFIGNVAKVMGNKDSQNFMPVLGGQQGLGKSRLTAWLVPDQLKRHYSETPIDPDKKDRLLDLVRVWIWEVSELGAVTRRKDREALKHFLTTGWINERVPYGTHPINKPAITSFIGTANFEGTGLLNDTTGSRRFFMFEVDQIDWNYSNTIDVNQLWAEAFRAYLNGEPYTLTPEEQTWQAAANGQHQVVNPFTDLIAEKFVVDLEQKDTPGWQLSSTKILNYLDIPTPAKITTVKDLAAALRDLGLEQDKNPTRGHLGRTRYWRGIKLLAQITPKEAKERNFITEYNNGQS